MVTEAVDDVRQLDRLMSNGMPVREVYVRAAEWWDTHGRDMMGYHMRSQSTQTRQISTDPTSINFLPSNILRGVSWAALDKRERTRVAMTWYHTYGNDPAESWR